MTIPSIVDLTTTTVDLVTYAGLRQANFVVSITNNENDYFMDKKNVWFVTGASKGLGLALVKQLLQEGYRVAATSRTVASLEKEVGTSPAFLALDVQLTDEKSVNNAIAKTIETVNGLDVVVNNAGYGQIGTLEELTDEEARRNFDVNVFGALNVVRSAMPHFRKKRAGYFINVSSIAGMLGTFAGFGVYCATKFAMVGFTESLSAEAKVFGVNATVAMKGKNVYHFNTIQEFHKMGGLPKPELPLVSLIDYSLVNYQAESEIGWMQNFYSIGLKRNIQCKFRYGQQQYDFDDIVLKGKVVSLFCL